MGGSLCEFCLLGLHGLREAPNDPLAGRQAQPLRLRHGFALGREPCSLRLVAIVQGFQAKELADWIERESMKLVEQVFATHSRFRCHATVTAYLEQRSKAKHFGKKDRANSR